ncbi:MAG TPA: aldolase/citrate lyase family protein [Chloroflexota bacterium]
MPLTRRVYRAGLTMPINNPRFVDKAWTRGCDGFQLDLEDSVPQSQKAHARTLVREAMHKVAKGGGDIEVRINMSYIVADVDAAAWPGIVSLNMGHTLRVDQIRLMDECITRKERERGIRPGTIHLQYAPDMVYATVVDDELIRASDRIRWYYGGGNYDYSLSLGVEMFTGLDPLWYPRALGSLIARAHDKTPSVVARLPDTSGSVSDAERAFQQAEATRKLGGRKGSGLHPAVVEPSTRGLTPPAEEVDEAQRILAFWRELDERGEAEGMLDGKVVDRYEAARAEELIDWTAACAEKDRIKERKLAEARAGEGE